MAEWRPAKARLNALKSPTRPRAGSHQGEVIPSVARQTGTHLGRTQHVHLQVVGRSRHRRTCDMNVRTTRTPTPDDRQELAGPSMSRRTIFSAAVDRHLTNGVCFSLSSAERNQQAIALSGRLVRRHRCLPHPTLPAVVRPDYRDALQGAVPTLGELVGAAQACAIPHPAHSVCSLAC